MSTSKNVFLVGLIIFGFCTLSQAENLHYYQQVEAGKLKLIDCDVAAYGGTPASFTATIQAARRGNRAILASSNEFVGGLTSAGLTAVDAGARRTIGGLAHESFAIARALKSTMAEG